MASNLLKNLSTLANTALIRRAVYKTEIVAPNYFSDARKSCGFRTEV